MRGSFFAVFLERQQLLNSLNFSNGCSIPVCLTESSLGDCLCLLDTLLRAQRSAALCSVMPRVQEISEAIFLFNSEDAQEPVQAHGSKTQQTTTSSTCSLMQKQRMHEAEPIARTTGRTTSQRRLPRPIVPVAEACIGTGKSPLQHPKPVKARSWRRRRPRQKG